MWRIGENIKKQRRRRAEEGNCLWHENSNNKSQQTTKWVGQWQLLRLYYFPLKYNYSWECLLTKMAHTQKFVADILVNERKVSLEYLFGSREIYF